MQVPSKSAALKAINAYEETLKKVPELLDSSDENAEFWAEKLNLSRTAISNKKHGRRDWKAHEVKKILEILNLDVKIVDVYLNVLDNVDKMIALKGYQKLFIYNKVGLSNVQKRSRTLSTKKDYSVWQIEEIKKLVTLL